MSEMESFGPYLNARVRGLQSLLFTHADLDALQEKDEEGMIHFLLSSPYKDEMAESLTRYQGADAVEDAASRNLVNTFGRLMRASGGEYRVMTKVFFGRWDLIAVKSLLRNRHQGLDAETGGDSLFPGPSMPVALMNELAAQNSMDGLIKGLVAWNSSLCRSLADKQGEYQSTGELRVLEEELDRHYFSDSMRRLNGAVDEDSLFVLSVRRMEIDRINLRILFEPRDTDTSAEDVMQRMMPGGRLSESILREISTATTPERALPILEKTPYAALAEALEGYSQGKGFSQLERLFETVLLNHLGRAAQQNSIGIGVPMRYAWLKYNEVMNIRMIARCLDINLAPERIREELVYV